MNVLEQEGVWWSPEDPGTRFPGVLQFDAESGATLRLFGRLPHASPTCLILLGETTGGALFTLFDGFRTRDSHASHSFTSYHMNYVLRDHRFEDNPMLDFHQAKVKSKHLQSWYGDSGAFDIQLDSRNKRISVSYELPEALEIPCSSTMTIILSRVATPPTLSTVQSETKVVEDTVMHIVNTRKVHLKGLVRQISHLENLFALLMWAPTPPTHVSICRRIGRSRRYDCSGAFFASGHADVGARPLHPNDMFLPHSRIQLHLPLLVQAWSQAETNWKSILDPFFHAFYYRGSHPPDRFLSACRALEAFHRDVHRHGGRSFFADRIAEVFDEHRDLYNHVLRVRSKNRFAKTIKDLRNQLTHSNPNAPLSAAVLMRVHHLADLLLLVVACALLRELGLPDEISRDAVAQRPHFRYLADEIKL